MKTKDLMATFSLIAYDPEAEEWGIGVASKYLAVGAMVPWAKAGVGAIATQAWGNPGYGPAGLKLLGEGQKPEAVIKTLTTADPGRQLRQLAVIDAQGKSAVFTGKKCSSWAGSIQGENFSVQGNLLQGEQVTKAIANCFQAAQGRLAERLLKALQAGENAGGDKRGRQAAALLVVKAEAGANGLDDRYLDLRVDDHTRPLTELERLLKLFYQLKAAEKNSPAP